MKYRVESIGAAFSDRDITALSEQLTSNSAQGWEFHSVFSVQKTGCFGSSDGTTYLAVFQSED